MKINGQKLFYALPAGIPITENPNPCATYAERMRTVRKLYQYFDKDIWEITLHCNCRTAPDVLRRRIAPAVLDMPHQQYQFLLHTIETHIHSAIKQVCNINLIYKP